MISESGTIYKVTITIKDSMKDLKLKKKLSGIGGGECIICETRPAEWKDVAKIRERFPITRGAEETRNLFEKLMLEGDRKIQTKSKDHYHRQGLTQEPKTSNQHSICVLHSYINVLDWFLKVLYHCESGYEFWVEKTTFIGESIR